MESYFLEQFVKKKKKFDEHPIISQPRDGKVIAKFEACFANSYSFMLSFMGAATT